MKKILKFIIKWNELLTIPLGLLLWYLLPTLMRWSGFDETAGQYDSAVFQKVVFAIVAVAIFSGMTWIFIKLSFPKIYRYLDDEVGSELEHQNLSAWEKSKISLWLLSLYFLAFLLALSAI